MAGDDTSQGDCCSSADVFDAVLVFKKGMKAPPLLSQLIGIGFMMLPLLQ